MLVAATVALAFAGPPQLLLDEQGYPVLRGADSWRVCPPDEPCVRPTGRPLDLRAGTRVEALAGGAVTRTATWTGRLTATAPPAISGTAATSERVTIVPGAWTGGWGTEVDRLGAIACKTPDAIDFTCRSLTPKPDGAVMVHEDLAGYHLRAVHQRLPADAPKLTRVPVAYSAPVAIAQSPPSVTLRTRMIRFAGGYRVGTVRCWPRCSVTATVRGKRRAKVTFTVTRGGAIVFPKNAKLRPGRYTARVSVDGVLRADGPIRLRR